MKTVEVVQTGAIYIDGSRITNRSTKPRGVFTTVFKVKVSQREVVKTLVDCGICIKHIDTEPYLKQTQEFK